MASNGTFSKNAPFFDGRHFRTMIQHEEDTFAKVGTD
jgi:hypothetical protein